MASFCCPHCGKYNDFAKTDNESQSYICFCCHEKSDEYFLRRNNLIRYENYYSEYDQQRRNEYLKEPNYKWDEKDWIEWAKIVE